MHAVKNIPHPSVLRNEFGRNKEFPQEFEEAVLYTLFHFPELKDTPVKIRFQDNAGELYKTEVSFTHFLKKSPPRFIITFKSAASEGEQQALFRNLPAEAQIGALAHELGLILYLTRRKKGELFRITYLDVSLRKQREMERSADVIAIEHGLGHELYTFASCLHSIPGLIEKRKNLEIYRLSPNEILQGLSEKEIGHGV